MNTSIDMSSCRVCWTCKRCLPRSSFYKGDIAKYYNCKECENRRLAVYRRERKERLAIKPDIECRWCYNWIKAINIARDRICAGVIVCRKCNTGIMYYHKHHVDKNKNCVRLRIL